MLFLEMQTNFMYLWTKYQSEEEISVEIILFTYKNSRVTD